MTTAVEERAVARIGAGQRHEHTPSQLSMVRRICAVYRRATDSDRAAGEVWYGHVRAILQDLADAYGVELETVAGVFAETSPRVSVATNVWITVEALRESAAGRPVAERVSGLGDRIRAAARVLRGDRSNLELDADGKLTPARKVRSFYANLLGSADHVTVDVWAARVAGCSHPDGQPTGGSYVAVARAYRQAAKRLGISPRELQATTWSTFRRETGGQDAFDELAVLSNLVGSALQGQERPSAVTADMF